MRYFSMAADLIWSSIKYNLSILSLNFSSLKMTDLIRMAPPENFPW
jgi:hypothetical protein